MKIIVSPTKFHKSFVLIVITNIVPLYKTSINIAIITSQSRMIEIQKGCIEMLQEHIEMLKHYLRVNGLLKTKIKSHMRIENIINTIFSINTYNKYISSRFYNLNPHDKKKSNWFIFMFIKSKGSDALITSHKDIKPVLRSQYQYSIRSSLNINYKQN